jgi:hypothetical protein
LQPTHNDKQHLNICGPACDSYNPKMIRHKTGLVYGILFSMLPSIFMAISVIFENEGQLEKNYQNSKDMKPVENSNNLISLKNFQYLLFCQRKGF